MRRTMAAIFVLASSLLASVSMAQDAPADPPKDKRICRKQEVTGSHVPRSICHKASDWVEIDKQERENAQQLLDGRRGVAPVRPIAPSSLD